MTRNFDFNTVDILALERALTADGYDRLVPRAYEIRRAGQRGALLWTPARLITTDESRIDARPEHE